MLGSGRGGKKPAADGGAALAAYSIVNGSTQTALLMKMRKLSTEKVESTPYVIAVSGTY
ncbi:hypothetical protein X759_36025 [Mesorhizobium sp. LSHC420B00]|uniref:hypothetical protein n=1 Tax=unclassified Mesorhizobium TaxID=325217 RepID=UPI0003CE2303|nr:hypothetical protein [Mesorhizobium sp. LSHC420B00]ESX60200.1 hypothetical protein X759_36025 [Mesorhizobium sp. LSHC420B00]